MTAVSTELINYTTSSSILGRFGQRVLTVFQPNRYKITPSQMQQFLTILKNQGITELVIRLNSMNDWNKAPNTAAIADAKAIINMAAPMGIAVSVDLHTWYTTWDSNFDDSASGNTTKRVTYINYVKNTIGAFAGQPVKAWMVLNEPQAQTASSGENQFILNIIAAAKTQTTKPVSVRFMCGYSPSTGHYSSQIDVNSDFICRNSYWDARKPGTAVYGTTEAKILAALQVAHSQGKEFWITEFGRNKSNQTDQKDYVKALVEYAKLKGIDKVFCWVSQPINGSGESYNIFNGFTPLPAFYELKNSTSPTTTQTTTVTSTTTTTTTKTTTVTPTPTTLPPDPCKPYKDQIAQLQLEVTSLNAALDALEGQNENLIASLNAADQQIVVLEDKISAAQDALA